jgi:peptidoglycan/LPS O-acetylase OafA/YrhL
MLQIGAGVKAESAESHKLPRHLPELTGARAVAALSVLIAHALDSSFAFGGQIWAYHSLAARLAYFGMSLFFVLSGFVIQLNYEKLFQTERLGRAIWLFFVARFNRLYPLYAFSILLCLQYVPSPLAQGFWPTLSYLTLTQSWFNTQQMIFPPDWSVSTEWFFYAAFIPATFVIAKVTRPGRALITLLVVTPIALLIMLQFRAQVADFLRPALWHGTRLSADVGGWLGYFAPYIRIWEFFAGVLAAKFLMTKKRELDPRANLWMLYCVLWFLVILVPANLTKIGPLADLLPNFIYAPAITAALLLMCRYDTILGRALASKPMLALGEISYSIYIWSWTAMTALAAQYQSPESSFLAYVNSSLKVALIVIVTIVFAIGSYQAIERPVQRFLRRRLS